MNEALAIIAVCMSILTFVVMGAEKLFGGGNKLANQFADLRTKTTAEISALRTEFYQRVDEQANNYRIGIDAITANIHALQMGLLEFRAQMAENYMRRDSYHKATDELKRDFKDDNIELKEEMRGAFKELREQLDNMTQAIEAARRAKNN